MRCSDCRQTLDAYIDQQLPADRAAEVAAHLAGCADCAREHATLASVSNSLKEGLVHFSAPPRLQERIRDAIARADPSERTPQAPPRPWSRSWTPLVAAGLAIAIASSALTAIVTRSRGQTVALADQIVTSHIRSLMPGHLTDVASSNLHNVKPWFAGRIALSPSVPNLDSAGFPLAGGRLDYLDRRPVAAVVYLRRQHVINVYSWPEPGPDTDARRVADSQGYHLVWWRHDGVESWAISDVDPQELERFTSLFK